ncbi:hypothetical protein [Streptomyces sp. KL116D]|uniref:hypothetical protein n=1 Tax=Streptomyces sp. KL116D TaxID=3045152 RepID=UPI0035591D7D
MSHPTPPPPGRQPGDSPWARRPAAADSPWAATGRPAGERVTNRARRVVDGLPAWEPLPPGETVVRRPGSGEVA